MAAAHLPRDILELFLDELTSSDQTQDRTVGLCGLVCKGWLAPSRARIFSTVVLRERNIASFLEIVKSSPSSIQSLIHTLRLRVRTDDTFLETTGNLGCFPEVTTLEIEANIRKWVGILGQETFPNNFPRLMNLTLTVSEDKSFSAYDIFFAIQDFPTLESLEVNGEVFDPLDGRMPEINIPPNWHTLRLEFPMSGNFFETFFEMADAVGFEMPVFSSLSMQDAWPQHRSFMGRYLWHCGSKLRHLRFDVDSENMLDEPGALSFCKGLRTLDLRMYTRKVPHALLSIFKALKSSKLLTVNVIDPDNMTRSSRNRPAEWNEVDRVLAEDRFAKLSRLNFTSDPALATMLRENMPLCAARGIIQVGPA